eukprot:5864627-Amphidinium_carterae.1
MQNKLLKVNVCLFGAQSKHHHPTLNTTPKALKAMSLTNLRQRSLEQKKLYTYTKEFLTKT